MEKAGYKEVRKEVTGKKRKRKKINSSDATR